MTFYFVDTSAFVKRYHLEAGSSKVTAILTEPDSAHLISRLGLVEANSAFALTVRGGQIQMTDFTLYRKRVLADVRNRTLSVIRVRVPDFKLADKLLQKHGMTSKLRTLDSLQLATALDLRERAMQITLSALTGICAGSRQPKGYLSSIPKLSESWQEHAEEAPIIRTKFKN